MFSSLFLLTALPTWLAGMALTFILRRRQQELEQKQALALQRIER